MIYDVQKASMLKRASAWLLDMILVVILACGFGMMLSNIIDYDAQSEALFGYYEKYEKQYGVDFDATAEELEKMTKEEQDRFNAASEALLSDPGALHAYNMVVGMSLIILSASVLLAYLCLEFAVPLLLKNGQTVGKKIFGIALMRADGIRLTPFMLFVRTVLGKYTIETMLPLMAMVMLLLGTMGGVALAVLLVLVVCEVVLMLRSKTNSTIHDYMSATVAVDFSSQMIFDTPEDKMAYHQQIYAECGKKETD